MFQSFVSKSEGNKGKERLNNLRIEMQRQNVTAFLIPHADEHQNEYLPERAERLAWLTGFTGSAGFCIATMSQAIVFTDGRYTVQANEQTDADAFQVESSVANPPHKWLEINMSKQDIIAYDPWLVTVNQLKTYEKSARISGATLKPTDNLIDRIWQDQPATPIGKVFVHEIKYAGVSASQKISDIQKEISQKKCELVLLTDPASLAWLFNIRGTDMIHNPLALGFSIVPADGKPTLFMDERKLDATTKSYLAEFADLKSPEYLEAELSSACKGKNILIDPDLVAVSLAKTIEQSDGKIIQGRDPVILPRAMKNETELNGARNAHIRDGIAMCKFLCWLDAQTPNSITEIDAAKKLEAIRMQNAVDMGSDLKELSFDTISAAGHHAALPHYRVNEESNLTLEEGKLYLVDSGGQYNDGTTDITRTTSIGTPPAEAVTDFTLVLKGHIAIDEIRFPKGTRGIDLDVLARSSLWKHGKDYGHGTGHGIGSYMNVHEGPQGIHRRAMEPLQPGMIISNEPGYYVEGAYGIRIENLVIVSEAMNMGGNVETHSFENITWAPIDTRMVDTSVLNEAETSWINTYHEQVFEKLSPHLDGAELAWLEQATSKI